MSLPPRAATGLALLAALLAAAGLAGAAPPEAVTIKRDRWGVPHVFERGPGAFERGAYAAGYAQAQDRLFQMDLLRRAAAGRLAARLGPDYLRMDQVVRRDGFTRLEQTDIFRRLTARNRRGLEAYRDGVNAWIEAVTLDPRLLPLEFTITPPFGPPEPWEVEDTVAVSVLQLTVFGASGGQEVLNAALLIDLLERFPEAEAQGIFDDLFWVDDPAAPTTIAADVAVVDPDRVARFAPAQYELVRSYAESIRAAAAVLREEQGLLGGLGRGLGAPGARARHASNAIVIGRKLSASGVPLLLGGPQTGLTIPSFFWEIGLHGGGYDAEGVIAPVGPGVLIGRGRNFAVTITSGILDNVDTFFEFLAPGDSGRYLFRDGSRPFERRNETFQVNGQPDVTVEVLRTVHGPVFFVDQNAGIAFSRRAALRGEEMSSAAALVAMGFARSLKQFRRIVADRVAGSLNLHYADRAGNIAYFHRGTRPLRPHDTDPRLPLDGRGAMEWRGTIPPHRMPTVVNPRQGFITNWNNKPVAGWSAGEQRELWGVVDRVQVFIDALAAARAGGRRLTLDDVDALMRRAATSDIFALRIVPFLEAAVAAAADPVLTAAAGRVRAWVDAGAPLTAVGRVVPQPGAAIYTAFRTALQPAVFADELGDAGRAMDYPARNEGNQEDDHGSLFSPDALLLRALFRAGDLPGVTAPPALLPTSRDYLDDIGTPGTTETRAQVLVAALRTALATLAGTFATTDQTRWQMPALRATYMEQGTIGAFFGESEIARENRGSFNLLVELARRPRGEIIVPPGQSGSFTLADANDEPPHLRDQLRLYEAFAYRRLPFTEASLEGPVTEETIPVVRR